MKKYLPAFCLVTLLCLLLPACTGNGTTESTGTETNAAVTSEVPTDAPLPETDPASPTEAPATEPATQTPDDPVGPADDLCEVPFVYPTPADMSVQPGGEAVRMTCNGLNPTGYAAVYADVLTGMGFEVGGDGVPLTVTIEDMSGTFTTCSDEGYVLTIKPGSISIRAGSDRGVFYALLTLGQLKTDDILPVITVRDSPTMPIRGVIEGFYGVAWTHEFRLELFSFMGKYKMNSYMYAPKDDPKHRSQWRTMYTGTELKKMQELVDTAAANRVKFIYAISPGLDFNLGSGYDRDFTALCDKCESMYVLGVRDFAILLDDIPTLDAEGHARLLNDFQQKFCMTHEGVSNLIAITPEFCDAMLTGYTDRFAPLLDPAIELMWTGEGVIPASINTRTLQKIQKKYDRRVLLWWNYPVNDGQSDNLFMDAARGLSSDLDTSVTGLLSNPMNQGHASFIPLFTIADYLWNPAAYKADASLEAAVRTLHPDTADALLTFIDLTCASPMNKQTDSKSVSRLLEAFKRKPDAANAAALKEALDKIAADAETLRTKGDPVLLAEINSWLVKTEAYADMGISYLLMEDPDKTGFEDRMAALCAYVSRKDAISANSTSVSAGVLGPWLAGLPARMDELVGFTASAGAPGIYTNLPTYQSYVITNAQTHDTGTFFWSNGAPDADSYIQLNLGSVQHVTHIRLRSGVAGHNDDYIHSGELVYSADGKTWTSLGKVTTPSLDKDVDVTAQYIRLKCLAGQQFWVTVGEFTASVDGTTDSPFTTDTPFASELSLLPLTDGSMMNGFRADPASAAGHKLIIDTNGCAEMCIYFTMAGENAVTVQGIDGQGSAHDLTVDGFSLTVDCCGYTQIVVTFADKPVIIGEIVFTYR